MSSPHQLLEIYNIKSLTCLSCSGCDEEGRRLQFTFLFILPLLFSILSLLFLEHCSILSPIIPRSIVVVTSKESLS